VRQEVAVKRRDLIKAAGIAPVMLAAGHSPLQAAAPFAGRNVVLFITDQQRALQHFPANWDRKHLPGLTRLRGNGLSFEAATCSTCMCSASRATLLTGYFPAQHGVTDTLELGDSGIGQPVLPTDLPNLASVMSAAGYEVVYKGKWHISKPAGDPEEENWTPSDLEAYGFFRWNPPDAGENQKIDQFGGGRANNDGRFMQSDEQEGALDYLRSTARGQQPFCLIVSLVNPHDVLAYPRTWRAGGYLSKDWLDGDIRKLPANFSDDLTTKPIVQRETVALLRAGLGDLRTREERLNYLNFYGNVMKEADRHLVQLLDTLDETGLTDDTVVIFTSDHGEMGLSHGGLRQKMYTFYEETLRVPLVYSNPVLFPKAQTSSALVSHVDFLPTLATLAGTPKRARADWQGIDYSRNVLDPKRASPQDHTVFTFDDHPETLKGFTRIASIRESRYKLARYWNEDAPDGPFQWEMYDLKRDRLELRNIAWHATKRTAEEERELTRLKAKLRQVERTRLQPL
jgi:choline-sulfatase